METKRRTVWVADDSSSERERSAGILRERYDVVTFADGLEVIERLGDGAPPDALLLDWTMTDLGGLEVLQFARAQPGTNELAIIVVTGTIELASVTAAMAAGADDFIKKPADADELLARLARLMRRLEEREHLRDEFARRSDSERQQTMLAQQGLDNERLRADEKSEQARLGEVFMGMLGHDLRTPLSAISLATGLLERTDVRVNRRLAATTRIRQSLGRMTEMIGQLLDLTRSRAGGGIAIERQRFDARLVCADVVDELRDAHPQRQLALASAGETELAIDPARLAQVVSNLVANALQHGDQEQAVRVSLTGRADEVMIAVHNFGPPIPAALLPLLFDPFLRAADRRPTSTDGIGLGLYISQQIVGAHGGTLDVQSGADGTTFAIHLPRQAPVAP